MSEISGLLNGVAHELQQALEAEAVVVMVLVKDKSGNFEIPIGSVGYRDSMHLLADQMPEIADELHEAADSEGPFKKSLLLGGQDNAN